MQAHSLSNRRGRPASGLGRALAVVALLVVFGASTAVAQSSRRNAAAKPKAAAVRPPRHVASRLNDALAMRPKGTVLQLIQATSGRSDENEPDEPEETEQDEQAEDAGTEDEGGQEQIPDPTIGGALPRNNRREYADGGASDDAESDDEPSDADSPDAPRPSAPERPQAEEVPAPQSRATISLEGPVPGIDSLEIRDGLVSLLTRDASLYDVLTALADHCDLNIVYTESIDARITVTLEEVPLEDALDAILSITGNTWTRKNNIILVSAIAKTGRSPTGAQGTELRVFPLDYAAANDVTTAVTALLSPIGKTFITSALKTDNHKTRDVVSVEDIPYALDKIESYIRQIDVPPAQVMIEARVLKIDLSKNEIHGVNLNRMIKALGDSIQLQTLGFANAAQSPALMGTLTGDQMNALIECLVTTTDAKTLASPKVYCLNGQEADFQVGKRLGYRMTTTTQTSTMQMVNYLNVGVILKVTPRVSRDGQIMMHVRPEVSDGSVDSQTGMPNSNTTQIETDALVPSGHGIVIGGLIQENDTKTVSKIPLLGDIRVIGRLFQKSTLTRERSEVIFVLMPRIVPYDPAYQCQEDLDVHRTMTPLLHGQLEKHRRQWETQLYDAVDNPRPIFPNRTASPNRTGMPNDQDIQNPSGGPFEVGRPARPQFEESDQNPTPTTRRNKSRWVEKSSTRKVSR